MEKETIKRLIISAQERKVNLIERDIKIPESNRINALIGPRRAGKTYLMYQYMNLIKDRKNIIYLNFEDERLMPIKKEDLSLILDSYYEMYPENKEKKISVFLDEIQAAPLWQHFVRRLHEEGKADIWISGSSSKLLSAEIATQLRGRTLAYNVFPYSFREFLNAKGIVLERLAEYSSQKFEIIKLLEEYIEFGGFPEIVDKEEDLKTKILQEYFEMTFYRDLVERYNVRNFSAVKEMMLYLVNCFASYFSMSKYHNIVKSQGKKIGINTLSTYMSGIADINFVFLVRKYGKLKEQFANPKKIYVIDTGSINAVSFKILPDIGRLYENAVFIELKRRCKDVYYWKNKYECDFLVKEKEKITEAIQVCFKITPENKKREMNGLMEAMDVFGITEGLIITSDIDNEETIDGKKIVFIPLWKWLLSK